MMMTEQRIPIQIRNDPAWVNVKTDSKIPWQSGKFKAASPSDKNTWSDFETALNGLYSGKYDGLGYCFHGTGLVGIDIDAGFDSDGFLSELACDIINVCKSYTEYSRSGRGVHILVQGKLPWNGANNRAGVEIYENGRYFIVTGRQLIYKNIVSNQDAINYIVEKYFPDVSRESHGDIHKEAMYKPLNKIVGGKLVREFPPIGEGGRNCCLTSYAGALAKQNPDKSYLLTEIQKVNQIACNPPLEEREIESIVRSVMRYGR